MNIFERLKMKKGKAKLLSDTDIKNCIRYIDEEMGSNSARNRLMFYFMLMTALRIHSIQKLTIGQVYKENYVPMDTFLLQPEQNKGRKKELQVYINSKLKDELKKYAKKLADVPYRPDDYLFKSNKGAYLSKQQIIHIFRTIFNGVGLDKQYRVHSLRATCLTNLMNKNYPLALIQQISGHSSINTLSIYYRSNPTNIKQALESLAS